MCKDFENGKKNRIKLIKKGLIKGKDYVSFSGGKDSTAMLLMMIEKNIPFDEIVFADTGFEYEELYSFIDYVIKRFPDLNIVTLKPKTFFAKELFDKNIKVRNKLLSQGRECVELDFYPKEWTDKTIISLWDFWFYGVVSSKKNAGTIRSYPLTLGGCWYKREAKVKPLEKYQEDASNIFIGIASDETRRQLKKEGADPRHNHPLSEWNITEKDCATYLQGKGLHNPIYDKYNRSGCFQCPRQNEWGLYMLWKGNPEQWEITKHYDNEARRLRGQGGFIDRQTKEEIVIQDLEDKFVTGYVPKKDLKFECHSCKVFT